MRLHARNLASAAGAAPGSIDGIVDRMVSEGNISLSRARDLANRNSLGAYSLLAATALSSAITCLTRCLVLWSAAYVIAK